jgi:hypothetical protein
MRRHATNTGTTCTHLKFAETIYIKIYQQSQVEHFVSLVHYEQTVRMRDTSIDSIRINSTAVRYNHLLKHASSFQLTYAF